LKNSDTAQWIIDQGYDDYTITCDSAEPKSINDYRDMGLPARAAIKGPGSVDYGMKYLQGYTHVIDPKRTPVTYKEYTEYEYERDKEGNVISGYPDHDNHTIDADRYALESHYNRRGNTA
jgi:phage terminase large subunit